MQAVTNVEAAEGSASRAFEPVKSALSEAVREGVFPGAVLYVGRAGKPIYRGSFGNRTLRPAASGDSTILDSTAMSVDTVFDIASVTAGIVTTTLVMKLVEMGRIRPEERVSRHLQGFGVLGKSPITIQHLLSHTSGLPAWHPFYEELIEANESARLGILTSRGAHDYVQNAVMRFPLKGEVGGKPQYSDMNFMVLGFLVEAVTGLSLDRVATDLVLHPLRMRCSSFIDIASIKSGVLHPVTDCIAPTEECNWRGKTLCGEVHDDNAWAMGGIAGHAGLFSTGGDLHLFGREMILASLGRSSLIKRATLETFVGSGANPLPGKLGWDSPSRENGMIDSGLSSSAFGINGFTGCSIWIDPAAGADIVLMTNRIHPYRSNKKIQAFRPNLHKLVLEALGRLYSEAKEGAAKEAI